MRILLILFTAFLVSCASNPDAPEIEQVKSEVERDLGLIKVQNFWEDELDKCTPVKTAACILTAETELAGRTALNSYIQLRSTCVTTGDCNACEMTKLALDVLSIIGKTSTLNLINACSSDSEIDDILDDLEEMEIEDV